MNDIGLRLAFVAPFVLQAMAFAADEFYYHRRRGLPLWELIGHPCDTFFTLLCFVFVFWFPPTVTNVSIFIGLAIVSCLSISKDEVVHYRYCSPPELWLHSLMFMLHPIMLMWIACLWTLQHHLELGTLLSVSHETVSWCTQFLFSQIVLVGSILTYQVYTGGKIWLRNPSTTNSTTP